jgi:uncharacterized protein YndB with AHSA1/START domain
MSTPVVIERTYDAPIEKVWQALTNKEKMKEWYFKLDAFEAIPGFTFEFWGGSEQKQYLHRCRVTEVVPGKKIAYTWEYDGYPGSSEVSFELFDEAGKTKLRLTHTGLETFPAEPDFARTNFEQGWTYITGTSLEKYLNDNK